MKDTLKFAFRLFVCIVAVSLLSFAVVIFVGMDSPELTVVDADNQIIEYASSSISFLGTLCTVVCTLFLCVMVYHYSWDTGFKDYNRKFTDVSVHYPLKGLAAGFMAVLPVSLIGILSYFRVSVYFDYIYRVLMAPFIYLYNRMYNAGNYLFCYSIILIVPVVSTIGYILGKNGFVIGKRIVYGAGSSASEDATSSAMDIMNESNRKNLK